MVISNMRSCCGPAIPHFKSALHLLCETLMMLQSSPGVREVPQICCSEQAGDCQQVVQVCWVPDCLRQEYETHSADKLQQQGDAADNQHHDVADEPPLLLPVELPAVPRTPAGGKGEDRLATPRLNPIPGGSSSFEWMCPQARLCRLSRARQDWQPAEAMRSHACICEEGEGSCEGHALPLQGLIQDC